MNIINKEVGNRIKRIRSDMGITAREFGKLIDKENHASQSLVSRWERGVNLPNNERLKKIAELGNISVNELLYGNLKQYVYKVLDNEISSYGDLYNKILEYLLLVEYEVNYILSESQKKSDDYKLKVDLFLKENNNSIADFIKTYTVGGNDVNELYNDTSIIVRLAGLYIDDLINNIEPRTILNDYTRLNYNRDIKLIEFKELQLISKYAFQCDISLKTTDFLDYTSAERIKRTYERKIMEKLDHMELNYYGLVYLTFYISKHGGNHQYIFDGLYELNRDPYQGIFESGMFEEVKKKIIKDALEAKELKDFNLTFNDLTEK